MEYQSKLRDDQVDMLFDSISAWRREECYRFESCTVKDKSTCSKA